MADKAPKATTKDKKPKRRLKAQPTFREQTAKQDAKDKKPSKKKRLLSATLLAPLRFIGRVLKKSGKKIAQSRIAKVIRAIYLSRVFIPVRFIVKVISKVLFVSYFVNSWKELRLVTWPDNRTTWRLTGAVLFFGIMFGLVVAGLDFVLEKGFREVLLG